MSASEKLKALAEEHDGATVGALALLGLPLPQVVAVVEAAERAAWSAMNDRTWQAGPLLRREVAPALTALEQELTNPQGKD